MNWGEHMAGMVVPRDKEEPAAALKCVLCGFVLGRGLDDDEERGVCSECKGRPEAKRLGAKAMGTTADVQVSARDFTEAERSLIKKVHGYMQPAQLLSILNERLMCDLGPDALPYTMEQLHAEIGESASVAAKGAGDWAGLRKVLAEARKRGVLARIDEQVVQDFAVVFQLNAKQVMSIKDIVLGSGEEA